MNEIIEFFKGFNIQSIISIFGIGWYFKNQLKKEFNEKFDRLDAELDAEIGRIDQLANNLGEQNKRIDRLFVESTDRIDKLFAESSQRIDRLYQMFCDLLKAKNNE